MSSQTPTRAEVPDELLVAELYEMALRGESGTEAFKRLDAEVYRRLTGKPASGVPVVPRAALA